MIRALVLAAMLVVASAGDGTGQDARFRAETRRVFVDVLVHEQDDEGELTLLTGLSAADFEVLDEGVVQEDVVLVEAQTEPLSVLLLLDTSASVEGQKLQRLVEAARSFLTGLDPDDEVSIMTFGTRFEENVSGESPLRAAAYLEGLRAGGSTSLVDALFASIVRAEASSGRPVVIVFSDGEDNASWLVGEDLAESVRASPAVVYAVRIAAAASLPAGLTGSESFQGPPRMDPRGRRILEGITVPSGGRLIMARSSDELGSAFERIGRELRGRYLLAYEPANVSRAGWHELSVRLKSDRLNQRYAVRHRRGYFR